MDPAGDMYEPHRALAIAGMVPKELRQEKNNSYTAFHSAFLVTKNRENKNTLCLIIVILTTP
jgi:hypothetical protein